MEVKQTAMGSVDYSDAHTAFLIASELFSFTEEETLCRSNHQLELGFSHLDPSTQQRCLDTRQQILNAVFPGQSREPYHLGYEKTKPSCALVAQKVMRYFPPVEYCCEDLELLYIHSGQCSRRCGGRESTLRAGDFCLLEYNTPHRIINNRDDCIIIRILIQRSYLEEVFSEFLNENAVVSHLLLNVLYTVADTPMLVFHTGTDQATRSFVYAIYKQLQAGTSSAAAALLAESLLNALFVILLREHTPEFLRPEAEECTTGAEIIAYIRQHESTVTLSELAQVFSYNESYMSRFITTQTGYTFLEILRQIRMNKAAWLLRNTTLNVSRIAEEVHCVDSSHLCRVFRKDYHMAPGEYRQLYAASPAGKEAPK